MLLELTVDRLLRWQWRNDAEGILHVQQFVQSNEVIVATRDRVPVALHTKSNTRRTKLRSTHHAADLVFEVPNDHTFLFGDFVHLNGVQCTEIVVTKAEDILSLFVAKQSN